MDRSEQRRRRRRSPAAARSAATSAGACADTRERQPARDPRGVGDVERHAAEVDAVRADRQRNVDSVVDVERTPAAVVTARSARAELGQRAAEQILLAELHGDLRRRQAAPRDAAQRGRDHVRQRAPAGRAPIGDQVEAGRLALLASGANQ